jgi:hypothetical protein
MGEPPVLLVELERDLGERPLGWAAELQAKGVAVFEDDLGRPAIDRSSARAIYSEHRAQREAADRRRVEVEQQAVEKDQAFRNSLPRGVAQDQVPVGVSPGLALMLSDPQHQTARRESPVEHALQNSGSAVYHPLPRNEP